MNRWTKQVPPPIAEFFSKLIHAYSALTAAVCITKLHSCAAYTVHNTCYWLHMFVCTTLEHLHVSVSRPLILQHVSVKFHYSIADPIDACPFSYLCAALTDRSDVLIFLGIILDFTLSICEVSGEVKYLSPLLLWIYAWNEKTSSFALILYK